MGVVEVVTMYWYIHLTNNQSYKKKLSPEERRRRDRRTPRIAIRRYAHSAFLHLFHSGDNQALLNYCGIDHKVYRELVDVFAPLWNKYTVLYTVMNTSSLL